MMKLAMRKSSEAHVNCNLTSSNNSRRQWHAVFPVEACAHCFIMAPH